MEVKFIFVPHVKLYATLKPILNTFNLTIKFSLLRKHYYLLTYLCGHKNPLIRFRPASKLLCRHLYFACASSSSSRQAKSGPLQRGLSYSYAVVPSAADRQHSHKHSSRRSVFIHSNDMVEPAVIGML